MIAAAAGQRQSTRPTRVTGGGGETRRGGAQPAAAAGDRQPTAARAASTRAHRASSRSSSASTSRRTSASPDDGQLPDASISARASSATARWSTWCSRRCRSRSRSACGRRCSIYLISIPLGIAQGGARRLALRRLDQRRRHRRQRDPGFLFAILLIVLFAGGSYFDWFPLRGLVSDNWRRARPGRQASLDYFWHMALPMTGAW